MKVLLIDDSRTQQKLQKMILRKHGVPDEQIGTSANGLEALEVCQDAQLKLIIVDWNMPVMDGLQFIKHLRGKGDSTPVLMVTSESDADKYAAAMNAGANGFVTKPLTEEKLVDAARVFLKN